MRGRLVFTAHDGTVYEWENATLESVDQSVEKGAIEARVVFRSVSSVKGGALLLSLADQEDDDS